MPIPFVPHATAGVAVIETGAGVVHVVLDRSASQNFGERKAQTDAARAQIEKALEGVEIGRAHV